MDKGLMLAIAKFTADEFGINITNVLEDEVDKYLMVENENDEAVSVTEIDGGYLVTEFDKAGQYIYDKMTAGDRTGGAGSWEGNACEVILTAENYRHEIKNFYNETLSEIESLGEKLA